MAEYNTKTVATVVGVLITAIIGAWLTGTLETNDDVLVITPQVEQNTKRLESVEQWQADWPSTGELSADVRQTKDIEFLKAKVEGMENDIGTMKDIIREIELEQAMGN